VVVIQAQFKALIDQVQALTDIFVWKSSQKADQPQQLNIVMSEFCFIQFFFFFIMDGFYSRADFIHDFIHKI
jgi:hypothetical protein